VLEQPFDRITLWSHRNAGGAQGALLVPSGLSACVSAILASAGAGDHILVPDNTYATTRHFCDTAGVRFGIEMDYYYPTVSGGIEASFRLNTRAVFTESGSNTFGIQGIPAIDEVAHRHDALVTTGNTWATPIYFKPLAAAVDISVMAATKYVVGHSDALSNDRQVVALVGIRHKF
jgi:cysteine-S-conjugate beta-lyase